MLQYAYLNGVQNTYFKEISMKALRFAVLMFANGTFTALLLLQVYDQC